MFDWHSEYLVIQARQNEMAAASRLGRWLAEARSSPGGSPRLGSHRLWGGRNGLGFSRQQVSGWRRPGNLMRISP
jgi:hypothetical protein